METLSTDTTNPKPEISTFVFLDFESTGLLDTKPRVTELCLLAVHRIDLRQSGSYPRVTNKLTLCLDPRKPIGYIASSITGLYNDNLENQKPLSPETVSLINNYLNHLAKPVCLLAHNGNRFDFPLLMSELKRINVSLDNDVMCVDTLEAFRSLDGLPRTYTPSTNQICHNNNRTPANPSSECPVTPSTSYESKEPPPVLKRKCKDDSKDTYTNTKALKPDTIPIEYGKFDVDMPVVPDRKKVDAEKVKKKLVFEQPDDASKDVNTNTDKETNDELIFSESLDDDDYLIALDMVEKEFVNGTKEIEDKTNLQEINLCSVNNANTRTNGNGNTRRDNENMCIATKDTQIESEHKKATGIASDANVTESTTVSCVDAGTGYFVRNTDGFGDALICDKGDLESKTTISVSDTSCSSVCEINETIQDLKDANVNGRNKSNFETTPCKTTPTNGNQIKNSYSPVASTSYPAHTGNNQDTYSPKPATKVFTPAKFKSYKLEEVHLRIFGAKPPATHKAEDDCIALVRCAKGTKGFMEWIDENAVLLSTIKPAY